MNWKKVRRRMRRWVRRHRHHLLTVGVLAAVALVIAGALASADVPRGDYDDFLNALGMQESSNDYTVVNRFHYMGRYQMGEPALQDAGFMDKNGDWTELANSYGIYSEEDFLHSPQGQDAAVTACHKKLCSYIRGYGLDDYIGKTYCGVEVTASGLLAACHLVGVGSLRKALAADEHVYDGNHISAAVYMERFGRYDISEVWQG